MAEAAAASLLLTTAVSAGICRLSSLSPHPDCRHTDRHTNRNRPGGERSWLNVRVCRRRLRLPGLAVDHPSAQTPPEFAVYLRLPKTLARTSPNADRSPLQGCSASDFTIRM